MDTQAGAWRRPTTTSTLPWGRAPSTQIPPSWEPSESSSLQSLVSAFCLRATAEDVVVWLQSMKSIWLDSSRYCRWSEPLWWSERSFLLDPKGGYLPISLSTQLYFPFSREHCWPLLAPMSPTCTLVFRWSCQNLCFNSCALFISDWLCLCKPSQRSEGGVPFLPQQKWPEQTWCMWWGSTGMSKVWASEMAGLLGRSEP